MSFVMENSRLFYELIVELKAEGLGAYPGFFEVEPTWRCPCCFRSKREIARLDKHRRFLCPIVSHHDHLADVASGLLRQDRIKDWSLQGVIEESFARFRPLLVCQDCNVIDPVAKRVVGAKSALTFAPHEIAMFVIAQPRQPHKIDEVRAREVYAAVEPMLALMRERLRTLAGP